MPNSLFYIYIYMRLIFRRLFSLPEFESEQEVEKQSDEGEGRAISGRQRPGRSGRTYRSSRLSRLLLLTPFTFLDYIDSRVSSPTCHSLIFALDSEVFFRLVDSCSIFLLFGSISLLFRRIFGATCSCVLSCFSTKSLTFFLFRVSLSACSFL